MFSNSNPFSTKFWTPGRIAYQFDGELDVDKLSSMMTARVMQVVGPHGSGKSTLLQTLAKHLEQQGRRVRLEMLNDQNRRLPPDFVPDKEDSTIFLLDGAEQLPVFTRFCLRFRRWNLLLTTHRPVFGIPVLYRAKSKFEIFEKLVHQYLIKSPQISFDEKTLRKIFSNAGGNFRTAFFELYDLHEKKEQEKKEAETFVPAISTSY